MSDITLSKEAVTALMRLGATVADIRPDLNGKVTDTLLIEAAIFHLFSAFYTDFDKEQAIVEAFNMALLTQRESGQK